MASVKGKMLQKEGCAPETKPRLDVLKTTGSAWVSAF